MWGIETTNITRNALCEYYDVHKADIFKDLFGPLYIGKNPTPWHNKHIVLKFDLSTIDVCSIDKMEASFSKNINRVLSEFVKKYEKELEYPEVNNVIKVNACQSLMNILVSYYTLFIVDTHPMLLTCYFTWRLWLAIVVIVFL